MVLGPSTEMVELVSLVVSWLAYSIEGGSTRGGEAGGEKRGGGCPWPANLELPPPSVASSSSTVTTVSSSSSSSPLPVVVLSLTLLSDRCGVGTSLPTVPSPPGGVCGCAVW